MVPTAQFRIFDFQHLAVLFILAVLAFFVAWAGMRLRGTARLWLGRALAGLLLCYALALYFQAIRNGWLHLSNSLPMQLCDWVLIACLVTLIRPNILAAEIAYFWGLGGTLQAVLTPDITQGFPSWRFLQFFWGHGLTLLGIVYIVAARHFMPRPRSTLRMLIALNVYGVLALSLDLAFGWNYGYLIRKPAGSSLFDYLGPWPWYLLWIEAIAVANFWLLGLPWQAARGQNGQRPPSPRLT
jgi:hypothetical integral membrane protein (TIGR02206 family)